MIVREVRPIDAAAIASIYAHHVLHGTATFDTNPPDASVWRIKIADLTARGWPFLIAETEARVVGYAYVTQFRDRAAYPETCENSIHIAHDALGVGVGTRLLTVLIDGANEAGFCEMIAVIGGGEPASIALHTKLGFTHAGRMRNVGRKFGKLLDTVYMQRSLSG